MPDIPDLHLRHSSASPDIEAGLASDAAGDDASTRVERTKWIVLLVLFVVAAGVLGYVVVERQRAKTTTTATARLVAPAPAPAAKSAEGPLVQGEKIALPPLSETDALVRELVVKLSSHPKVLAWLATNGLIENFTVATLNVSDGNTPTVHWRTLAPQARFSAVKTPQGMVIDPRSYRRYDDYAAAVAGLDAAGTARLYLTLKPRILDAYRGLGFPEGDFDPVLERAIKGLVATPAIGGDVLLREKVLSYEFVNPEIESLTSAQKQLLRMGPDNMRAVQGKLREIAAQLGLHP